MRIVGPVVLEPWERRWAAEKKQLERLLANVKRKVSDAAVKRFTRFLEDLYQYRVLDPACGSGNFLYVALRSLKGFEKRVILEAEALGLPRQFPRVGPEAVMGIEVNPYAAELARVTVWIGEIQWMLEQGFGVAMDPILKPLDQIECRDALLTDSGTEAVWPKTHAIVGNPPFLGSQSISSALPKAYVESLRSAYRGSVAAGADLCSYWLHKARQAIGFYPDSADTFAKAHTEPKECPCRSASITALSTSGSSSSWSGDHSRAAGRSPWRSGSTRTC
jgi:hypothetical protein